MSDIRIKMAKDLRDMSDMVGDLHWMAAKAVEDLTKKEGEIAKRDARIMGLESQYQRDVWGLNNEGDPIGGEPAGGYANDNARLRAALKAQEPVAWPEGGSDAVEGAALGAFDSLGQPEHDLESWCAGYAEAVYAHAAPVSEAKAQGVVMPPPPYMPEVEPAQLTDYERGEAQGRCDMWAEVARLKAAPVQQVSVPDGWRELAKRADDFLYSLPETDSVLRLRADLCSMLAAPAAPAADAGDALEQAMYTLISIGYHENSGLVHELRQALSAHRAKGVV